MDTTAREGRRKENLPLRQTEPVANLLLLPGNEDWQGCSKGVYQMPAAWWPSRLFTENETSSPYAIVILNQPLNERALSAVIEHADVLVCADGAANRLYAFDQDITHGLNHRLPDAIVGDLDSLRPDVEEDFRSRGVNIEKDADQYSTDFAKCLKWIRKYAAESDRLQYGLLDVIVLGGLGGRVDQGFSQIHHLYMAREDKQLLNGRIYLLSEQSLSFILDLGRNVIHIEPDTFEENVGIIPFLGPTRITTKGLEWDVTEWDTEFGGHISTSNHIRSNEVEVEVTGREVLFTVELAGRLTAFG